MNPSVHNMTCKNRIEGQGTTDIEIQLQGIKKTHKYSSLKRISKDVDVDAVLYLVTAG